MKKLILLALIFLLGLYFVYAGTSASPVFVQNFTAQTLNSICANWSKNAADNSPAPRINTTTQPYVRACHVTGDTADGTDINFQTGLNMTGYKNYMLNYSVNFSDGSASGFKNIFQINMNTSHCINLLIDSGFWNYCTGFNGGCTNSGVAGVYNSYSAVSIIQNNTGYWFFANGTHIFNTTGAAFGTSCPAAPKMSRIYNAVGGTWLDVGEWVVWNLTQLNQSPPPPPATATGVYFQVNDTGANNQALAFTAVIYNSTNSYTNITFNGVSLVPFNGSGTYSFNLTFTYYQNRTGTLVYNNQDIYINVSTYSAQGSINAVKLISQGALENPDFFSLPFTATNGFNTTTKTTRPVLINLAPNISNNLTISTSTGFYPKTYLNFTTPAFFSVVSFTGNMSDAAINFSVKSGETGAYLPFNITILNDIYGFNYTAQHNNSAIIELEKYLNFNVSVSSVDFTTNYSLVRNLSDYLLNLTLYLYPINKINISIWDEQTRQKITPTNVSILFRGSYTGDTQYSTNTGELVVSGIYPENYQIIFNATTYSPRSYYLTILNNTYTNLYAYLLQTTLGTNCSFQVKNNLNQILPDATISAYIVSNGSSIATGQGKTNIVGDTQLFLSQLTNYQFTITAEGFATKSFLLVPNAVPCAYTISLDSASPVTFTSVFDRVSFRINPIGGMLNATLNNFTMFVTSPNGTLDYYSVSATFGNQIVTTSPAGGYVSVALNSTTFGNALVTYCFKDVAFPIYCVNYTYILSNFTPANGSIIDYGQQFAQSVSPIMQVVYFTGIAIILIVGFIGFGLYPAASALIGFILAGVIFLSMGWLAAGFMGIIMGLFSAIFFLRGQGE